MNPIWIFILAAIFSPLAAASDTGAYAPSPSGGQVKPVNDFDLVEEIRAREPTLDELREIKKLWNSMKNIQERPAGDQPRPTISMMNLNLAPGATPPLVRISDQTGVILTFLDANGKKWPVELVRNLSAHEVEAEEKPAIKDQNSVFVKAKRAGGLGNIAVFLRDFDTPIVITLLAGQKDVDYRMDFRVPATIDGRGGDGVVTPSQQFDDRLVSSIMGITPAGCKKRKTDNVSVMAWACGDEQIIRARGILLAPATIDGKRIVGQSDTSAWVIPQTPVVSMLIGGASVSVRLGDNDEY